MGLDGGTFVSRSDIMRRSSSKLAENDKTRSTRGGCVSHHVETAAAQEAPITRYRTCALSGEQLGAERVVVCRRGKLYNRSSFEEFILREGRFESARTSLLESSFGHLRGPRDVVTANIAWIPAPEAGCAVFYCPATMVEANGSHRFAVVWRCGCVVSLRVLQQTHTQTTSAVEGSRAISDCPGCGRAYKPNEIVGLFPESEVAVQSAYGERATSVEESSRALVYTGDGNRSRNDAGGSLLATATIGARAIATSAAICRKSAKKEATKRGLDGEGPSSAKRVAMPAPMPKPAPRALSGGWERLESKSKPGKFYYRNIARGLTQWDPPTGV